MNAKILVVDDSSLARRTLRQILESVGHTVEEATNGAEGLEKYFLNRPDIVFLDMVMEHMQGLEVLRKLREMDPHARVIVATADIQSGTRMNAENLGAYEVINKPFTRDRVLSALENVLAGRS
ncbi:MAG: response regulator [Verrucomicrobia bacterium]|nr:response regulator [Verrucomicrobiota bacterium]